MPKIKYVSYDKVTTEVEAELGSNLMQAAIDNGIAGIDADCGGVCACGTCHVFIKSHPATLSPPEELEQSMLSMRPDVEDSSRLGCQVVISADMDGMVVQLPEFQM
jgi:2Fe-2S ferredoxin